MEGWLSGRKQHTANVLSSKGLRGFESHPFRFAGSGRRARADEKGGLENRYASNGIRGSNPLASAYLCLEH